ncbi:ligase-associated DNA damage response endonuclease PdeM [Pelagibacteraceae bacterium]|nr:ligase-associated DNA damage response endonuclease PdeM [Pelagibacteraceae bacterium]
MYYQLINFGDEEFYAYPNKSLYWKRLNTLIVSDLHIGKSISYAKNKQFLPPYDTKEILNELFVSLDKIKPRNLIIVGDLLHDVFSTLSLKHQDHKNFNQYMDNTDFIWIKGNHDKNIQIEGFKNFTKYKINKFLFTHIPIETSSFQICGHYHPKVKISHRGKTIFKTSFVHNEKIFILPSFGILTGGLDINSKQISSVLGKKNLNIFPVGQNKVYKL